MRLHRRHPHAPAVGMRLWIDVCSAVHLCIDKQRDNTKKNNSAAGRSVVPSQKSHTGVGGQQMEDKSRCTKKGATTRQE